MLIGTRETTNNDDGRQGTTTQSTSVNKCVEVEHLQNHSIEGQLCEPVIEHKELSIEECKFQGTKKNFLNHILE